MAIVYCKYCNKYVDSYWDCEHFDEDGDCVKEHEENMDECDHKTGVKNAATL